MITITRALQLVYDYSEEQAKEFLAEYKLSDEHPNPFVEIEERIKQTKKGDYDWYFCTLCMHYDVLHFDRVFLTDAVCSKCGGKMV